MESFRNILKKRVALIRDGIPKAGENCFIVTNKHGVLYIDKALKTQEGHKCAGQTIDTHALGNDVFTFRTKRETRAFIKFVNKMCTMSNCSKPDFEHLDLYTMRSVWDDKDYKKH